jgi:hypothetical protein
MMAWFCGKALSIKRWLSYLSKPDSLKMSSEPLALIFGTISLLYGGIKGIHIDTDNFPMGVH